MKMVKMCFIQKIIEIVSFCCNIVNNDYQHESKLLYTCNMQKMRCYLIEPRYWIFVKGFDFLSFAKNKGKDIGKNIIKRLNS